MTPREIARLITEDPDVINESAPTEVDFGSSIGFGGQLADKIYDPTLRLVYDVEQDKFLLKSKKEHRGKFRIYAGPARFPVDLVEQLQELAETQQALVRRYHDDLDRGLEARHPPMPRSRMARQFDELGERMQQLVNSFLSGLAEEAWNSNPEFQVARDLFLEQGHQAAAQYVKTLRAKMSGKWGSKKWDQ